MLGYSAWVREIRLSGQGKRLELGIRVEVRVENESRGIG
jgi:hypothetical protein